MVNHCMLWLTPLRGHPQDRLHRHRAAFDAARALNGTTLIELRRLEETLPGLQQDLNDAKNHEYSAFAIEAAENAKKTADDAIAAAKTTIIANRKIVSDAAAAIKSLGVFRTHLAADIERTREAVKTIRNTPATTAPRLATASHR